MSASSDYLGTLGRLEEAKAAGQANAIQAAAQATSEATRANAGLWGNSIATIGQMVAQYPEQQAKLQQIKNQAANTELERQKLQIEMSAAQRQQQIQQASSAALSKIKKTPDGLWDVNDAMQQLAPTGLDPVHLESFTTGLQKLNDLTLAQRKRQSDANADLAHGLLGIYKPDEPITPEALSFSAEALKGAGGLSDADAQAIHDITGSVPPGTDLRPVLKAIEQKKKDYQPVYEHAPEGSLIYEKGTGVVSAPAAPKTPKTWAEIALDAQNDKSPTQSLSKAALETREKVETAKALNPASVEYYVRAKYGDKPTPDQVLKAHEEFAKATAHGTAAGDIPVKVEKYDSATGRTTITYMPRSQAVGQEFQKPPSATLANRLESAKAVNDTGNDIINRVKDPKVAAMLGPLSGRYNTVRDFIGDPPPELAELAGQINSYAIAQMGVHGMRNAQAAQKIEEMLSAKFTPESLIAKIRGINDFGTHLLQNQGRDTGASSTPSGVPAVGGTFQGGKVLKVTPVP